jgi:hypothetical protein
MDAQRTYGKERCMRMTGYTCLLIIALVLLPAVCLADTASHRKAADALLTVIKAEQDIQQSADRLAENLLRQNPQLAPHNTVVKTFITKHMNWPSLKEDVINLYVQAFTEDELKQLTTFYRSPIGQKAADKMPELVDAGTQLGITRLRANREELDQMIGAEQKKPEKQQ